MKIRCFSLPEIPREDPSVNPLLRMITEVTPDLSNVTARQCYFGFGQALLEFESTFLQMEQKCRGRGLDTLVSVKGILSCEEKCKSNPYKRKRRGKTIFQPHFLL